MATMLNKTAVVKVLVAAYVARGLGVDHRTVSEDAGQQLVVSAVGGGVAVEMMRWAEPLS